MGTACKTGCVEDLLMCLEAGVDVNHLQGWGLRRAVRYRHTQLWQIILTNPACQVNLVNNYGLSALHTACRFGVTDAVVDILQHPAVLVNEKTTHGSTPIMVAVKYCQKVTVETMIRDSRVDLNTVDKSKRSLCEVVGVAVEAVDEAVKLEIIEMIKAEGSKRSLRKKKKGIVHKVLDPSQLIVKQARDKVDKLVNEMEETQRIEMLRFQENLENNSREFNDKQKEEQESFSLKINEEKKLFFQNQENQRNRFLSELEQCKYVFLRMQEEARHQFDSREKLHLVEFKEMQAKQRQSFQLSNKADELAISLDQTTTEADNPKSKPARNLNVLPSVSDLVGRNSFSLPSFQRYFSSDKDLESSWSDQSQMTRSLNIPRPEKNSQICHRKSAPVMGPSLTKENNSDLYSADQFSKHSHLATNSEWRKISCPLSHSVASNNERYLKPTSPSYPDTPPPSPATAPGLYIVGQNLSPSNTSSNPSPVPSLEYIPPNELFTKIPDTCPNIKALVNSQDIFLAPQDTIPDCNESFKASPPSFATYPSTVFPIANENSNLSSPSSFIPVKVTEASQQSSIQSQNSSNLPQLLQESSPPISKLNFVSPKCPLTPRLTRKGAMEVVKEEEDDQQMKDDDEIAELTNTGIARNKSSSFTNLVSNMKSPTPSRTRGVMHPEEEKRSNKGDENKRMFFLEMESEILDEEIKESKERSKSLPETNIPYQDMKENISEQFSGLSLASSTSSASFKSAQTSPVKEFL